MCEATKKRQNSEGLSDHHMQCTDVVETNQQQLLLSARFTKAPPKSRPALTFK